MYLGQGYEYSQLRENIFFWWLAKTIFFFMDCQKKYFVWMYNLFGSLNILYLVYFSNFMHTYFYT